MNKLYTIIILALTISSCEPHNKKSIEAPTPTIDSEAIISNVFASDTLREHGIFSTEWQAALDKALSHDPTNAYLWQQKSMPLYKQGKYQLGRPFLDNAALHDPDRYLEYRAFMLCIFEKNYKEAIVEFESCISKYGDSYVMDHSYSFYIALSKIQLHQFAEAEVLLMNEITRQKKTFGEQNLHFLDNFYLGISRYELNDFQTAIEAFDTSLQFYSNFADAQFYKARCLQKLGKTKEADKLLNTANINGKADHSINEDNAIYERYPYQIRWKNY